MLNCHAGCAPEDIVSTMGLTMRDLFADTSTSLPAYNAPQRPRAQFEAEYIYRGKSGESQLKKVKMRESDGGKFCYWMHLENGIWTKGRDNIEPPLYTTTGGKPLPHGVFLVEGEKDVETFKSLGKAAATLPDGAKSQWRSQYGEALRGRTVVIIQDNDTPGKEFAQRIAGELHGIASSVKVVDLSEAWPELPEHGDVTDLIGHLGPEVGMVEILRLARDTAEWVRTATNQEEQCTAPPDYSDAGNAAVFSRNYQDNLIFVDALGWLWWNGKRWERDDHKVVTLALELSARMLKEAGKENREALHLQAEAKAKYAESGESADGEAVKAAEADVAKTKAYLAHAKNTRNAIRIKNMMELSKPALVLKADKLDANPFDLNTPAGIINLTTGQLMPNERTAYCSQITQATPEGKGTDMWGSFLDTITCNDGSIRGFLQLVAGMALIGSVYQEGIVIAYGGGRNGKSTFFNTLGNVLGDYTGSIDIKTITTDRANKGASLATLRGKRLVITGELEEHQRLSVATLKQLASTDKLVIEEKFKQPETVTQTHTLILFTNHLPRVGSTDGGTWRRLIVVPFNATIPAGTGVQNYADVLVKEAGGAILSWAIEGAVNFVRNGFKLDVPEVVAEATEAYREREDWLNNFIDERCIKDPNARVGAAELYREYREWAEATGDYVRRLNDFTIGMEAAGFQKVTPKNKKTWVGIRLDLEARFGTPYAASY